MADNDKTPATFLAQLGQALKRCEGVDAGLAEIIAEQILTAAPATDGLEQAMTAIATLAASRATDPRENTDG
jgi:hypothetical protein